jgi:hypothetical protein
VLTLCRLFALSRRELATLLAAFVLSLPAVTPRIYSSDEIEYFSYLRSIWFDHDVSFENEYRYFYDRDVARAEGFHETFLELQTDAGRRPNFGTIGCAILWTPFYAAGHAAAYLMRAAGREVAVDGFSRPYIAAVAYGSAFYGFAAILLSIGAARRLFADAPGANERSDAVAAGLLVWIGTPLLFYMYVAPPMSHACSAFAVALFVTTWLHVRRTWTPRGLAMLGASAALMAMVREQDLFFTLGPGVDFLATALAPRRDWSRRLIAAAAGAAAFAVSFAPQLLAYARLNGHVRPSHLVTRKMTWTAPHALDVLLSTSNGFFFWTPLAVVAIAGLAIVAVTSTVDLRRVALISLLMVALQVYVGGSVESWSVAGAFGQRRFVALTILLVIGLTGLWLRARPGAPRALLAIVAVACVWWNLSLIALFGTNQMDRKRLELGRNAYDAFVTVPRMAPQLAWRYVFHRESYYRSPPPARVP